MAGLITALILLPLGGARGLGRLISRFHSGQIQLYLGAVAVAVLALLLFYAWLA